MKKPQTVMGWTDVVATFEQALLARGRAATTVRTYASALQVFGTFYRDTLKKPGPFVARLQEPDLQAFVEHLRSKRHLVAASLNRFIVALHAFAQFALEQRLAKRDLARDLRTFHVALGSEPPRLSAAEVRHMVNSVDLHARNGRRDLALLQLLLHTGLRISELAALSVGDVTLQENKGRVRVRSENTRSERVLPLNRSARSALREYIDSRGEPQAEEPLFLSERRQRMRAVTIQHRIKRYLACAGREDLSANALRHHFARYLYGKTGKLTAVQEALGHRSIVTTARYARETAKEKEIEEAVEALPGNSTTT